MIKTAADIMRRSVITILPTATLSELALLMEEEGIHGVPVVNTAGDPIGVVSRSDLVSSMTDEPDSSGPTRHYYAASDDEVDLDELTEEWRTGHDAEERTVGDVMSTHIVKAKATATAGSLASTMNREKVHRILITDDGRLVGIVSSTDLLSCLSDYERQLTKALLTARGTPGKGAPRRSQTPKDPTGD